MSGGSGSLQPPLPPPHPGFLRSVQTLERGVPTYILANDMITNAFGALRP